MIITVRVNNTTTFSLVRWSAVDFNSNLTLEIQSIDLTEIKNAFSNIEKLEIFQDEIPIATFTSFDTYSQITYLGKQFVDGEKRFAECMSVTLTKADIISQVQRLDEQINPVIDTASMTLEEYRDYKIKEIQHAVQQDIFAGTQITLHDGTVETFMFSLEDQSNISNLYMTAISSNGKIATLPFHSHGHYCREYPVIDIIMIYVEMQKLITQKTTIANFTIQKAREAQTKEALDGVYYGMEFDTATMTQISNILTQMLITIQTMLRELGILLDPDQTDDEEPTNENE